MKVLIVVDDFVNISNKAGATMINELSLELCNKGHYVSVVTPSHLIDNSFKVTTKNKLKIIEFKSGKLKNISKVRRLINESILSIRAFVSLNNWFDNNKHDYIIYYSPTIFFGPLIKLLKYKWKVKSYLILRDVFPQWAIDSGLISNYSIVTFYFKIFEKLNYSVADKIGMMSENNVKWFKSNFNKNNVEVLFNWTSNLKYKTSNIDFKKKLNLENKVVLFYGGNIGHAQNMYNLIKLAIKFKKQKNAHFLFVGDGDEVELILKEKEINDLDNVTYMSSVDKNTYEDMLSSFDIGLFSLHSDHKTHNFPGKLLSYMSHSKPILGSCNNGNDLKEVINESKSGFIFFNGDDENLYNSCKLLIDSFKLRKEMGLNSNKLLREKFSVKTAASQIERFF